MTTTGTPNPDPDPEDPVPQPVRPGVVYYTFLANVPHTYTGQSSIKNLITTQPLKEHQRGA